MYVGQVTLAFLGVGRVLDSVRARTARHRASRVSAVVQRIQCNPSCSVLAEKEPPCQLCPVGISAAAVSHCVGIRAQRFGMHRRHGGLAFCCALEATVFVVAIVAIVICL